MDQDPVPRGFDQADDIALTAFGSPPMLADVAADQAHIEGNSACLCCDGSPCLSGSLDRIDAVGDDDVAQPKVVGSHSLGDDVSEWTVCHRVSAGLQSVFDTVDAHVDGG